MEPAPLTRTLKGSPVRLLHDLASSRAPGSQGHMTRRGYGRYVCLSGTQAGCVFPQSSTPLSAATCKINCDDPRPNKFHIYLSWASLASSQVRCGRCDNNWRLSKNILLSWKTFRLEEVWEELNSDTQHRGSYARALGSEAGSLLNSSPATK